MDAINRDSVVFSHCYRKLISLYGALDPWRLLFASHEPNSRGEHILCVHSNKHRIAELATEIGVRAADCLTSAKAMVSSEVIAYREWKAEEPKYRFSIRDIFQDDSLNPDKKRYLLAQNSEMRTEHRSREPKGGAATHRMIRSIERAGNAGESLSTRAIERLAWSTQKVSWNMIHQVDIVTDIEVGCRDACEAIGRLAGKALHEVRREMTLGSPAELAEAISESLPATPPNARVFVVEGGVSVDRTLIALGRKHSDLVKLLVDNGGEYVSMADNGFRTRDVETLPDRIKDIIECDNGAGTRIARKWFQ